MKGVLHEINICHAGMNIRDEINSQNKLFYIFNVASGVVLLR